MTTPPHHLHHPPPGCVVLTTINLKTYDILDFRGLVVKRYLSGFISVSSCLLVKLTMCHQRTEDKAAHCDYRADNLTPTNTIPIKCLDFMVTNI